MADPLDEVLRLVAEGWLTADEAGPVIDALQTAGAAYDDATHGSPTGPDGTTGSGSSGRPRVLRLEVSEGGRKVVNLRVPLTLGRMALSQIPGLSADSLSRIRSALDEGMSGPILVVDEDDDGDSVRIVLE
jgi:hypothetical protein